METQLKQQLIWLQIIDLKIGFCLDNGTGNAHETMAGQNQNLTTWISHEKHKQEPDTLGTNVKLRQTADREKKS